MRHLATIQNIAEIQPIESADKIVSIRINGWWCVAKKDEFKVGDRCVYFEIDSLLPRTPIFEFLNKNGTKRVSIDGKEYEGYRLRTIKLRGTISQGLALPISFFPEIDAALEEGADVSETLGVVKWEPPVSASLGGIPKGNFPAFIPKTDEERIQNCPYVLMNYRDVPFYVTSKIDGSSATYFYHEGEFGVCSRNMQYKDSCGNAFWQMAHELGLEEKLRALAESHGGSVAIQGEIAGPSIQKNPLKLSKVQFFMFTGYEIKGGRRLTLPELKGISKTHGIPMVPILSEDYRLPATIEELFALADAPSPLSNGTPLPQEGVVFRPLENIIDRKLGQLSFKVISNKYLLDNRDA